MQDLASASYYLPAYDLRQATLSVEALQVLVDKSAAELAPIQRFSFGSRSKKGKPASQPSPAREAAAAQNGAAVLSLEQPLTEGR